jgi:hypothetical protein
VLCGRQKEGHHQRTRWACLRALLLLGLDGRRVGGLQLRLRAPRGTLSASARARGTGWAVLRWGARGGVAASGGARPRTCCAAAACWLASCGHAGHTDAARQRRRQRRPVACRARARARHAHVLSRALSRACANVFQKMDGRRKNRCCKCERPRRGAHQCLLVRRQGRLHGGHLAAEWGASRLSGCATPLPSGRARARVPSPSSAYVGGPPPLATQAAACAPAAARCPRPETRCGPHDTWRRVAPGASCGAGAGRAAAQHNTRTGAAASPRAAPPRRAACAPRHASAA